MPNWCVNKLTISGLKAERERFKKQAVCGENDFAFESFLPLPKELDLGPIGTEEEQGPAAEARKKKYGYATWYDRNCAVLGTKWDVQGHLVKSRGELEYTFDSAWAPPTAGIQKVSKQFPSLTFTLEYDEPGGDFAGEITFLGGKVVTENEYDSKINEQWAREEEEEAKKELTKPIELKRPR